jgi:hypothetical protein
MFTGKVLNSEATLNQYTSLSAVSFIPGSAFRFVFQMIDDQTGLRHVFPEDAVIKIQINNIEDEKDEFETEAVDEGDRSMRFVDLTEEDTLELNGGNIFYTVTIPGSPDVVYKGYLANPLAKSVEGGC